MNNLEFSFGESPWETFLNTKQPGDIVSAAHLLTLLEGEEEQAVEDAMAALEAARLELDVTDLPIAPVGEAAVRLRRERQLTEDGLNWQQLESGDPLRLYLEEVTAMTCPGDETALAAACAAGDSHAREALTEWGLRRVIDLAAEQTGRGVLLLDLIQEGSLGLWQAVSTYTGGDYAAHRDRWIRFYMAKAIALQARANGVGQKMREALEDYRAVDERLLSDLGRNPTLEEIALELHMTREEAESVRKTLESARILAQAKRPAVEEDEEKEAQEQAVEDTAYFQMRQRIGELLSGLSEQDAQVLTLRFGLEGGLPLSPEDTGRRLGLTPEEVVARESAALSALRQNG